MSVSLDLFTQATRGWFKASFTSPTPVQEQAWSAISRGRHALVVAPTGSGKTLAAFLWAIDRIFREHGSAAADEHTGEDTPIPRTRVLYISPLKALGVDVERNLRAPLVGIAHASQRDGIIPPEVTVGVRSGDTPAADRRRLQTHPPDILITTPESLYLMLTSAASESLRGVSTVIIDEVHAVAATKRGSHLAVSLERLDDLLPGPAQRIGLSATVAPIDEVARFLGGAAPVEIVAPPSGKVLDLTVTVPFEDFTNLPPLPEANEAVPGGTGSVWPFIERQIVDEVLKHRSTIIFAGSRRLAERLTARLNEISALLDDLDNPSGVLAKSHHGSVAKETRAQVEDELKSGALRCVVATSSLELGIDMGAVDLVIQVEAPPSVASGLQRIGRAGHQVGEVSHARFFPTHRADVLHTAAVTERILAGQIEEISVIKNPLDVLAQQTVAVCARSAISVERWFDTVKRSAPFTTLPRSAFIAVLDLISGKFPSDEFAELRPRVIWDRDAGTITGRPGAQRIAVTSGGTIPDRGLFGVFLAGESSGARVGELDEEMVYESRVGEVFTLGTTSWKIVEITHDQVRVVPAFGQPGRVPFWRGDVQGRPAELGIALGKLIRELHQASANKAHERLTRAGLDENARRAVLDYLNEQHQALGSLPTDRVLCIERSRDEVGDWRIMLHSPHGLSIHAPWALAISARVRNQWGTTGAAVATDDGIVVRLPDGDAALDDAELFLFDPDELEQIITEEVAGSALFAARFRECAARALLMPRLNPGRRAPLWQQRQRASALLEVARHHPTFPIVIETLREVLQDVYNLPALRHLITQVNNRQVRLTHTETHTPSPFARELLFHYIGAFMYEADSPLAERQAAALSVDPALLEEMLGQTALRDLLDPAVISKYEQQVQHLDPQRRLRGLEGAADLLRALGPLSAEAVAVRLAKDTDTGASTDTDTDEFIDEPTMHISVNMAQKLLAELVKARRAISVQIGSDPVYAAIEDSARLRDALGVPLPPGIPAAFLEPVPDPLSDLVSRFARTHGPFEVSVAADALNLGPAVVRHALTVLQSSGRVTSGYFLPEQSPGSSEPDWCDAQGLRRIRLRSLAALRGSVEPVSDTTYSRFLLDWHHLPRRLAGVDGVRLVIDQLAGMPLPASAWESLVLPSRVADYRPAMLDELTSSGQVLWSGHGALAGNDGWVALHPFDLAPITLQQNSPEIAAGSLSAQILQLFNRPDSESSHQNQTMLMPGAAYFTSQLQQLTGSESLDPVLAALHVLMWAGLITNDTFAPIRSLLSGGKTTHKTSRQARSTMLRPRSMSRTRLTQGALSNTNSSINSGGRWSRLPAPNLAAEQRAIANAGLLLDRYGVVTRGAVYSEAPPGGFAQAYRTLAKFEDAGHCRRGYIVEGLGAAQFAASATIDQLRSFSNLTSPPPMQAVTLAATDPANPFGSALDWPILPHSTHRPGRKAGALVVLVDGSLVLYLERGGRTVLHFTDAATESDPESNSNSNSNNANNATTAEIAHAAAQSLSRTVRDHRLETLRVELVNGISVGQSSLSQALVTAGFTPTPRGLTLRKSL